MSENKELVKYLLSVKAPCVVSKLKGMTPLHIACKNELIEIV